VLELLSGKTVLIVEDDKEYASYLVDVFDLYFRKVYLTHNAQDAKDALCNTHIDVIFSDIHLGAENGLEFIEEVRRSDSQIPVVVISGRKDEELLFKAIVLGLTAYLVKPITFDTLTETLEKLSLKLSEQRLLHIKDGTYYDEETKELIIDGEKYLTSKKERLFIKLLTESKSTIIAKEKIINFLWDKDEVGDAALKNFILRIRKRFGKEFVYTVSDIGYALHKRD